MQVSKAGSNRCIHDNSFPFCELLLYSDGGTGLRGHFPKLKPWSALSAARGLCMKAEIQQVLEIPMLEATGALTAVNLQTSRLF